MSTHKATSTVSVCLTVAFGYFATISPAHAALLEGKQLLVDYTFQPAPTSAERIVGPALITVGPGVELTGFGFYDEAEPTSPALFDIDFSGNQIMISLIADQPAAVVQYLRFIDFMNKIPGTFTNKVANNPATTWTGFADALVQDAGDGIIVHISVARGREGQFILLDVVPEPASIALLACAVPAALLLRRRR